MTLSVYIWKKDNGFDTSKQIYEKPVRSNVQTYMVSFIADKMTDFCHGNCFSQHSKKYDENALMFD